MLPASPVTPSVAHSSSTEAMTATSPVPTPVARRLARIRTLTRLLDSSIPIPGTGRTLGLDPLLGLVPWVGDAVGAAVSGWLIWQSARLGAPLAVLARMLWNVAVETLLGVVPVLGDLFDAAWKSNTRNLALLEAHLADPDAVRAATRGFWTAVGVGVFVVVVGLVTLAGWILLGLLRMFGLG